MKIRSISSHILRVPLGDKTFYSSQAAFPERNSYLVRVETDAGLVGWGEGGQYGPPEPVAACVEAVLAPRLIGRDSTEPVRIWEELYAFSRDFGQKATYVEAISALDIALWDLAGQAAGLLGLEAARRPLTRPRHGLRHGLLLSPEDFKDMPKLLRALEEEAMGYTDSGFELLKIKIGLLPLAQDIERIRVIREAVGPDIGLLVDANHGSTPAARCGWAV